MKLKFAAAAWASLLLVMGCEQITEPVRTPRQAYPGIPTHLVAEVGDRSVTLAWTSPQGEIKLYYIFRKDTLQAEWTAIDSCTAAFFLDADLLNGARYSYCVSACNAAGFRGALSKSVSARPGLYSLLINGGALYTNSSTISLKFIAPSGTRYVKIALDSSLYSASWQLYSETMEWTFMPGDGRKYVYAIFLDSEGNQTGAPVVDDIYLDTKASIQELQMSNGSQARRTGDLIKLQMQTNEAYGTASVNLGTVLPSIRLYDDGTHGDLRANDGLYCHDYYIPPCEDMFAVAITGSFTDIAGNVSDKFTSSQTLTIENPPSAVHLFKPERMGRRDDALHLTWTVNEDADFSLYKLFRSTEASVDSTSLMVSVLTAATSNHIVDSLLTYDRDYYYRVYVYDQQGLTTGSNTVQGRTIANAAPQPAELQIPLNVTSTSMLLSWGQNNETDFSHYRLFRATKPAVSSSDLQIALISTRSTTQFQDSNLMPNQAYWYKLYTADQYGAISGSNIVTSTTLVNDVPEPVMLAAPAASVAATLRLTWSASHASDFASYRIYRSRSEAIDSTATPIVIINSSSTTTHDDTGLSSNTNYYYRIFVFDLQGKSAGSNIVKGATLP
jgi:fibronectin type 3 domain-containing protein